MSLRILLEDDLVEAVLGLATAGRFQPLPPLQLRRFHAERERCYRVLDPDQRSEAFARVHADWFVEWGFRRRLEEPVARFPELRDSLIAVVFRRSRGRHDDGAELYQDSAGVRRGVMAVQPDRLGSEPGLTAFLHHELAHLADLVDERFGYTPDFGPAGRNPSRERVVRERYRTLWAIRIDGRLAARRMAGLGDAVQRRAELDRALGFLPEGRRGDLFEGLWSGKLARHEQLLEVAGDPRGLAASHAPVPGAGCPLCGFAAFQWAEAGTLREEARRRIRMEFPGWQPGEPICARCAEIYEAIVGVEYPTTVCL